ncbi:MAG: HDOD domain-containing protein [Planctomycetes bacterium]|nr:HDOD domain-containing protein [Planctomycetota bacterium]
MHDTGKLILAQNLPDEYGRIIARARTRRISMHDAEEQVLGASHAEIGAYLLGLWGLPDSIVEAVAFHHQPAKCASNAFDVVTAVHVANALEHDCAKGDGASSAIDGLDFEHLATIGLADRVPEWRDICLQTISEEIEV